MARKLDWPDPGDSARGVIQGPAGDLELAVEVPAGGARGVAVICHPHPQHGGTLDNKVVFSLARAARDEGLAAVRFNFRGVGDSAGAFDHGEGEVDDVRAAMAWAASRARPLVLAGFSFGAAAALRAAAGTDVAGLVTVALPTRYFESLPRPDCPWLAVHGDADEIADCADTVARLRTVEPAPDMEILAEAGHFFHGRLSELREVVARRFAAWAAEEAGAG